MIGSNTLYKAHEQNILFHYCKPNPNKDMSYCPVYGCNSDAKKNPSGINFFAFPSGKSAFQQKRRKACLNSVNAKHLSHCQTAEFARFILPKTRTNRTFASVPGTSKLRRNVSRTVEK